MTTPVLNASNLAFTGAYGPAPTTIHVSFDPAGSGNSHGASKWMRGTWHFQLIEMVAGVRTRIDQAMRDAYPITDPTSSANNGNIYERFRCGPNHAFPVPRAGTFRVRLRYMNELGEWSSWIESADQTIIARSGHQRIFVDGTTGSDANDGSEGSPLLTFQAAMHAVSADNAEIICADDTTIELGAAIDQNLMIFKNLWIHRSGDGTNTPVISIDVTGSAIVTDDSNQADGLFVDGIRCTRDAAVTIANAAFTGGGTFDNKNLTFVRCSFGNVNSGFEAPSSADVDGLLIYDCDDGSGQSITAEIRRYSLFLSRGTRVACLMCEFANGSTNEHNIRCMSQDDTSGNVLTFVSIAYLTGRLNNANGKNVVRFFPRRWGAFESSVTSGGRLDIGNIDAKVDATDATSDIRMSRVRHTTTDADDTATLQYLTIAEDTTNVIVDNCLLTADITGRELIRFQSRAGVASNEVTDLDIVGNTFHHFGQTGNGMKELAFDQGLEAPTNLLVEHNLLLPIGTFATWQRSLDLLGVAHTGLSVSENGWYETNAGKIVGGGTVSDTAYDTATALDAGETFAAGNIGITSAPTVDRATGEVTISGSPHVGVVTGRMAGMSLNGLWWDPAKSVSIGAFAAAGEALDSPPDVGFTTESSGDGGGESARAFTLRRRRRVIAA